MANAKECEMTKTFLAEVVQNLNNFNDLNVWRSFIMNFARPDKVLAATMLESNKRKLIGLELFG